MKNVGLAAAHALYHDMPGNLMWGQDCGYECEFWDVATFLDTDAARAAVATGSLAEMPVAQRDATVAQVWAFLSERGYTISAPGADQTYVTSPGSSAP